MASKVESGSAVTRSTASPSTSVSTPSGAGDQGFTVRSHRTSGFFSKDRTDAAPPATHHAAK
jgi:hypothetical protein